MKSVTTSIQCQAVVRLTDQNFSQTFVISISFFNDNPSNFFNAFFLRLALVLRLN